MNQNSPNPNLNDPNPKLNDPNPNNRQDAGTFLMKSTKPINPRHAWALYCLLETTQLQLPEKFLCRKFKFKTFRNPTKQSTSPSSLMAPDASDALAGSFSHSFTHLFILNLAGSTNSWWPKFRFYWNYHICNFKLTFCSQGNSSAVSECCLYWECWSLKEWVYAFFLGACNYYDELG